MQAAFCGTAYGGVAAGHRVVGSLAGTGIPIYDIEAGCASGGAALQLAAASIASGQHDRVLVFGIEKMPKGLIRSSYFAPWQEAAGLSPAPAYLCGRRPSKTDCRGGTRHRTSRTGGGQEPSSRCGQPRCHVPKGGDSRGGARLPDDLSTADPLHVVFPQRRRRRSGPRPRRPRRRRGRISLRSHLPGNVLGEDSPLCGIDDIDITPPTALAANDAYARPDSDLTTSMSSSARTPMRPVNCWPGPSSACAPRGTRPAFSRWRRVGRRTAADQSLGRASVQG